MRYLPVFALALAGCQSSGLDLAVHIDQESDVEALRVDATAVDCDTAERGEEVRFDVFLDTIAAEEDGTLVANVPLGLEPGCHDLVVRPAVELAQWTPSAMCPATGAPLDEVVPGARSSLSLTLACLEQPPADWTSEALRTDDGCSLTMGYWKNHPEDWYADSIVLGARTYDAEQMMDILWMSPKGDASIILAHQAIATWLSIKAGALPVDITDTLSDMNWWFATYDDGDGLPYGVKGGDDGREMAIDLAETLTDWNEGTIGPGHCDEEGSGDLAFDP